MSDRDKSPVSARRRRAAVSCDHCKKKRSRCIRLNPQGACTTCAGLGIECENKHLRKQRVYGSVESLSQRFRALDALVTGLFPSEDTKSLDGLYRIAEQRGIVLPPRNCSIPAEDLFAPQGPSSPSLRVGPPETVPDSAAGHRISSIPTQAVLPDPLPDEKLVPTASGIGHYVGPSSSFRFVSAIRRLLRDSDDRSTVIHNSAAKQEFATLRSSLALEQGGSGDTHPNATSSNLAAARPNWAQAEALARFPTLPPRDLSDVLVRNFFDQLHPHYPLFVRPVFQLQYEALWETGLATIGATDLGWSCCLALILVFGIQSHDKPDEALEESRSRLLAFVRSSMGYVVASASLVNVQALLLLQLYEHNSGQRNASWILLGCASRMAIALGMHLEAANKSCADPVERSTRARVWWTMFNFERALCIMLGRPSAIDDAEMTLALPDASNTSDNGDMPLRYTEFSTRLSKMQSAVRQSTFCPPESDVIPSIERSRCALQELEMWHEALPRHLRPEWRSMIPQQRRANLLLQVYYENMVILVTRPYLILQLKRNLRKSAPAPQQNNQVEVMREKCLRAADRMLFLCQSLADKNLLDTVGWLDVYFIYLGIFVLSLDLLSPVTSDDSELTDRRNRKDAIKGMFARLRPMQLAPTYHILIKVAHQFASISGALAEDPPELDFIPSSSMDSLSGEMDTVVPPMDFRLDEWLTDGLDPMPWDSFDMGAYTAPEPLGMENLVMDSHGALSWPNLMDIPPASLERPVNW
ncbi:hypothetical protein EHS25_007838 [Saitozyma podzolica]|uniref:Zn(2)-C6 fungal-type domain-containing protein n=1 Tax=Saitozyma podzolica TaxID=1890683 RepID=A0A427YQX4_9TREE|nr:hypothetical protein EHS25_007838 [Saitozyma podzolica]